jgi:hypothetical protein
MLFDLRSRGRRRTVQVIYIGLAVLIGAGLILFGVGTGTGGGGLFGAFTGGGSSTGASGAVKAAATKAQKAAQKNPNDPAVWARLVTARFSVAGAGTNFNSTTNTYSPAGKQQLALVAQAWKKYEGLAKKPDVNTATLAARAYSNLSQYANAADAYQAVTAAEPTDLKGFECVAVMSFAAKNTRVGQLAENHVLAKLPKSTAKQVKAEITQVKSNPSVATQLGC